MPHVKLVVAYDGTDFYGSQTQAGQRTVQQELERTVQEVGAGDIRLALAGRTDRGVHAVGQVASGTVSWNRSLRDLRAALNAVGPRDIEVSRVTEVEPEFHARFSARWREYRYRLVTAEVEPVLTRRTTWWRRDRLDDEAARAACDRFLGRHRFGSFASAGKSQSLTGDQLERTVFAADWYVVENQLSPSGTYRELRIVADGFLPQMVRNITGAVMQVASGARAADWIDMLLAANDRRAMGEGAPPHGLVLWQVGYSAFGCGCQS